MTVVSPITALPSLRALLGGAIDYAGLFPPASLTLSDAAARYASYRLGPDAWALGRFVIPAARLAELDDLLRGETLTATPSSPWPLSVLITGEPAGSIEALSTFARTVNGQASIEAVEAKATSPAGVESLAVLGRQGLETFVEIPAGETPDPYVARCAAMGLRAKLRTGGVTPDAFPATQDVVRFLRSCHRHSVAFKATAGLHHPIRAAYPLTYEPGCASAVMFGWVNVFLAAILIRSGADDAVVTRMLEESDAKSLALTEDVIAWRGQLITSDDISRARADFVRSFGSCSFREPLDELSGWSAQS